jgi:hypothetical protein
MEALMRNRALLWLLVLCPILFPLATSAQGPALGSTFRVRPQVAKGPDGQDRKQYTGLREKDPIPEETRVVTQRRAGAAILVGQRSAKHGLVQLGPETDFTFEKWVQEAVEGGQRLRLYVGQVLALFSPESGADEHTVTISIGSPDHTTARLIAHGTGLYVQVSPVDGSTFVYVLEGVVTVESLPGGGSVTVRKGEQTRVAVGHAPTQPAPLDTGPEGRPDLKSPGEGWLFDPPLVDLNDPRLDLPK